MEPLQNILEKQQTELESQVAKKELREAMSFNPRTFTKKLTALLPDIKMIDSHYEKTDNSFNPRVARFIVDELGFDIEIIRKKILANRKKTISFPPDPDPQIQTTEPEY